MWLYLHQIVLTTLQLLYRKVRSSPCVWKSMCVYNKPWTCATEQQTVFAAGFTCPQAFRIYNQSTFLHRTQSMWTMCVSLTSSVPCASVCRERDGCEGGYSSLSLRTKSLYICTYVVLKSYTFGLSGAGPGSFTWDPVPNERTSKPRLLQREKKKAKTEQHRSQFQVSDRQLEYEHLWAANRLTVL